MKADAVLYEAEEQKSPGAAQSHRYTISLEFLRLICVCRIRKSCLRPEILSEVNHKSVAWLEQEIATSQRRLRAIEYEFRVKSWPLPDYEVWKRSGVYAQGRL